MPSPSSLEGSVTTKKLVKDTILCREKDLDHDLYLITQGKLLICVLKGSQVTPLAFLGPGQFLGELSFFDKEPRSANVIAVEDSEVIQIPVKEIDLYFPEWLLKLCQSLTKSIRLTDEVIREAGIKKKQQIKSVAPLSVTDQTHIFQILKQK